MTRCATLRSLPLSRKTAPIKASTVVAFTFFPAKICEEFRLMHAVRPILSHKAAKLSLMAIDFNCLSATTEPARLSDHVHATIKGLTEQRDHTSVVVRFNYVLNDDETDDLIAEESQALIAFIDGAVPDDEYVRPGAL
ncbi:hypothetical protein CkaCkLH20_11299 [Colletotrichum karsti]|uniref:Uncharacterized protein n=1 Tax=Colletotrichum karsti TaxID=1095194 RepID=A0A9P6HVY9_9PEZI|nr:uncharacterized protein CkaCkLH20_11299 [Colletotrichum karsti]KAF9871130.1 hypothetical protein CkaCkLH20_11299 [Colletotrichum karsti]